MVCAVKVRWDAPGVCVARYYDPSTGQFLSVDPAIALTETPYSYVGDDPVNEADPSGLAPDQAQCETAQNSYGSGPLTSQEVASQTSNGCKSVPEVVPCPVHGTSSSVDSSGPPTETSTSVEVTCTTNPNCYSGGYGKPFFFGEACVSLVVFQVCLATAGTDTFLTYGPGLSFSPPSFSLSVGTAEYGSSCSIIRGGSHSVGAGYYAGGGWAQSSSAGGPYVSLGLRGWADSFYTYGYRLTGGEC